MKNMLLIIPDVHGRSFWRKAIETYGDSVEKIIFLGDYLDMYEYEGIKESDQWGGFLDILKLKTENPDKVVLLLGNHDCQYFLPMESSSRYNRWMADSYEKEFMEHITLFDFYHKEEISGKRFLFSHAGILPPWVAKYKISGITTDEEVCWNNLPDLNKMLLFDRDNLGICLDAVSWWRWGSDRCGSIVWADFHEHLNTKVPDFIQVFGHTQQSVWPEPANPVNIENLAYCLDCRRGFLVDESGKIIDTETLQEVPVNPINGEEDKIW